jgi:trimeric autotransporter adhesin
MRMRQSCILLLALLIGTTASHAIPLAINYQGYLTRASGTPLDTAVNMTFKIYGSLTGGFSAWSETLNNVAVVNGGFTVPLGPINDLFNVDRWLGITIGSDAEMAPRQQMLSVAHAFRVGTVDGASGGSIASDVTISNRINVGNGNVVTGTYASVTGGSTNVASGNKSFVGGGQYNKARGELSIVAGGGGLVQADSNLANSLGSTVSGGTHNRALQNTATIGGGYLNTASGNASTISGGSVNTVTNLFSTICGGTNNTCTGRSSTVAGGGAADSGNTCNGNYSIIGNGLTNVIVDSASFGVISGGAGNRIHTGSYGTILGGGGNNVSGNGALAAGHLATAAHHGSFVWADYSGSTFSSTANNQFNVRSTGGVRMYTNSSSTIGVTLTASDNTWNSVCDSTLKTDIRHVNTKEMLEKVCALPISRWRFKNGDPSLEHISPMAQDFWSAFHVGSDSLKISTVDPTGVALAAIQELAKRFDALEQQNIKLQAKLQTLQSSNQHSNNVQR